MYSTIDVIEYNLNDNYRRYGVQSADGASTSSASSSSTNVDNINASIITTSEIDSSLGIITSIQADSITAGVISTNQLNGFTLIGPVQFANQPTSNLNVTNLSATGGIISDMTSVESDSIVLPSGSGSITLEANFLTTSHTLSLPPSNQVGVLMNSGSGTTFWNTNPIVNSIGIGDVSIGSSNLFTNESKLHVKGPESTAGGLMIESNADSTNSLAIFPDTLSSGSGIQKLDGLGPLTFYDTVGDKEFELDGNGDGVFYNNISGGGRLTLRVRTTTTSTDLDDDYILNVNNTGTVNVDLPSISDPVYTGVQYIVITQTANTVRIRGDGSDTIFEGGVSVGQIILSGSPGDLRHLVNNGDQWFVLPS